MPMILTNWLTIFLSGHFISFDGWFTCQNFY
jgi:hypothetical protein